MPTINIVFRGLLVLNKDQVSGRDSMEIGILDEPHHHTPRIMTFRNGVREETVLLDMNTPPVLWKLMVDNPSTTGITLRQHGSGPINRMDTSTPEDDFRWVINLENQEFPYVNIDQRYGLDRAELKHVVQITSGQFYTRLKSPLLRRQENGSTTIDFGAVAGVMGLEIPVNSGGAKLVGPTPNDVIFRFSSDPNVMYELANSPADTIATDDDHFPHYYEIFRTQPGQKFSFLRTPLGPASDPGPNPALCGKVYLGEFGGSLVGSPNAQTSTTDYKPETHQHEEHHHPPA